ncbi:MAG TPA: APC family permease [Nocardioidaceae bacterium]|nr:APC family permease [Nocardioidaceae bacterium]
MTDSRRNAGDLDRFGYQQELKRSLSFSDMLIYGLIFMVPIAPFGIFGSVYAESGGMVVLAYAVGAIGMAFTALSYSEMAKAFPMAGSVYSYAGRGIAAPVGFVAGWAILLDYILVPALLYIVSGVAMASFVPAVPVWVWVLAFIALNTFVNYFGIELTARVNKLMLVAELIVLAIFLVIGIWALATTPGVGFSFDPVFNPETYSLSVVFAAVSIAVLSFLGFDAISTLAEENQDEARQIGRAMVGALVLAGVLFVVQTWVAALLVPNRDALLSGEGNLGTAFYDAAGNAGGAWLSTLTAIATAIAWGFADALVAQAATSRVLFSMSRDRQLPAFLRRVHPTHRVPTNATFLIAAISVAVGLYMASRGDGIALLSTMVNFGALTAFLLLHVSVLAYYVVKRGSRSPRHIVLPICGLLILGYVMWSANVAAQVTGLTWLAIGIILAIGLKVAGRTPRLAMDEADTAASEEKRSRPS